MDVDGAARQQLDEGDAPLSHLVEEVGGVSTVCKKKVRGGVNQDKASLLTVNESTNLRTAPFSHLSAAGMSPQGLHQPVAEVVTTHCLGPQPAHHTLEQRAGVATGRS